MNKMAIPLHFLSEQPIYVVIPVYFALALAAVVLLNVIPQVFGRRDPKTPPIVFHWFPFIGNMVAFGTNPILFLQNCQKKYGDCFTWVMFGRNVTVCLGPEGNNFVFNGKVQNLSAAEAYRMMTTPVFGKEVVYDANPVDFMEQKKFVKAGLNVERFPRYVEMIVDESEKFFKHAFPAPSGKISITEAMSELIINSASSCLMGKEIREALESGKVAKLYYDLDQGFQPINFLLPGLTFLPSYQRRDIAQREMAQLFMSIIKRRRDENDTSNIDMLQSLMESSYKNGTPLPDLQVAHMMIAILFGGQHTSATTSSWTFLELARRPELVRRLREEQISALGSLSEPLSYDAFKDMPLLDNLVRESLRLHPPLFQMMRAILADTPFEPSGFVIPKGNFACAVPGVTQIDPTYFKDPLEFNPDRWSKKDDPLHRLEREENAKFVEEDHGFGKAGVSGRSPYLPFGAGRHRCIGEQFGYIQLKTIIATFVRTFDFELDPKQGFPKSDFTSMVVMPEKPANILYTWRA